MVIEVNPRLAGGRIPTLVRLATGIDLVGATVDAAIGAGRPLPEPGPGHASIRFLVAPQGGRVRRTGGVAAAAAVPGVVDVAIAARPGQRVGGTGSFLDRVGHVIAAAPDGRVRPPQRCRAPRCRRSWSSTSTSSAAAMAVG